MPSIIINDVEMEARIGERLLDVARRNAAHIGFVCDGNGICQTCQCRVLSGVEHLSPISRAEEMWFPTSRITAGNRLACQTAVRGVGPVRVLTLAEELRRQFLAVMNPPDNSATADHLAPLLDNLVRLNVDQLRLFPMNVIRTAVRVGPLRMLFPFHDLTQWVNDASCISGRMMAGNRAAFLEDKRR